jgi:hypothetical protein
MNQQNQRLYFLDWIRICAFFVLILYHTGMYYVTWDWHVKSPFADHAIEPLMMLSSPWRLSLLFLVAGVASAFLMQKLATGRFLRERSKRLLLPLLFGMLVIVPPQPYYEVVEQLGYSGSYLDFMRLYVKAYHGFCDKDGCLDLPTWNHLWFVAYLWVYTMVLGLIAALAGAERIKAASDWLARRLRGWKMIVLPALFLGLVRIALRSRFPNAGGLVDDWFNHATYLPIFLAGVLLATQRGFWLQAEENCGGCDAGHIFRLDALLPLRLYELPVVRHPCGVRFRAPSPEFRQRQAALPDGGRVPGVHPAPDADRGLRPQHETGRTAAGDRGAGTDRADLLRQLRHLRSRAAHSGAAALLRPGTGESARPAGGCAPARG